MCTSAPSHAGWAAGSGASCGGPASASRDGRPDGGRHLLLRSRGLLCRMKARHFQALPLAGSELSRELRRNGPVRSEFRRALTTSETCRVLILTVLLAVLPALRHGGTNPRGEYCPVPDCDWRCARVRTSSAPLRWPTQPKRTHARTQTAPTTHLELHDRLADHREQPRRQREQLLRELRVRNTGGDRRRWLPVPREQHRHEQLQPLQPRTRSFRRTRALERQENEGRRALPTATRSYAACCPVAVYP